MKKAIFNWSGGKDSALALYRVLQEGTWDIRSLFTTINKETNRISMHGVHIDLLKHQVEQVGLPLSVLVLPGQVSMDEYDRLMQGKLDTFMEEQISHSIFGDIFLEDLKKYREERLKEAGLSGHFPLWLKNTRELIYEFLELGFKTIVVAIDSRKLDKSFVGRVIDKAFIKDLPDDVDPCGENGEFHTFVFDGPIFKNPVEFKKGAVVAKEYTLSKNSESKITYWYQDLMSMD